MNGKDVEGRGRGLILGIIRYISEGLRRTTKNLSQNIRSSGRDLNPGLPNT
jgi:hypothetical protein